MGSEITVTISGSIGCGKTALMIEIEELLSEHLNLPITFEDPDMVLSEKRMGLAKKSFRADTLQMYKPTVVLKEVITR